MVFDIQVFLCAESSQGSSSRSPGNKENNEESGSIFLSLAKSREKSFSIVFFCTA